MLGPCTRHGSANVRSANVVSWLQLGGRAGGFNCFDLGKKLYCETLPKLISPNALLNIAHL